MEAIFTLILLFVGYSIVGSLFGVGAKAVGAGAKTLMEGGSFADNYSNKLQFKVEKLPKDEDSMYETFGVFSKGNPDVALDHPAMLIFKLFDKTTSLPIVSTFEMTSEESSRVFEHAVSIGNMQDKYWPDWSRVSALIPESLIGPHKGTRTLQLQCFLWYEHLKPEFERGYLPEDTTGGINVFTHEFNFHLTNPGYLEVDDERLEVQVASIKLAISIAMADGTLDKSEGTEIKNWVKGIVDSAGESQRDEIKETLNNALEEAYNEVKSSPIDIEQVCADIKDIGSSADKFDLIELCLDVMAADGEADKEELKQIEQISKLVGIDYDEISKMKDQRLIKLDPTSSSNSGLEEKLDIDPEWDNEKINKHILSLYGKWNGRLNSLSEGIERENAQKMLDLIAEARKKYS
ncbi:TerB family tellurite resistance protein [Gammaproteobacteria bacterium]|nr:TerB family tellurite resistance protein [Gammaproteobacteria bacterium]